MTAQVKEMVVEKNAKEYDVYEVAAKIHRVKGALSDLIGVADSILADIEGYSKVYDGYWLQKTWVHNKLKKKYFYYYLKSRMRKPRSIYLGTIPPDYHLLKDLKQYVARLRYIQQLLAELLANLDHLEFATKTVERLKKIYVPKAKLKAKDIPVDSSSS